MFAGDNCAWDASPMTCTFSQAGLADVLGVRAFRQGQLGQGQLGRQRQRWHGQTHPAVLDQSQLLRLEGR